MEPTPTPAERQQPAPAPSSGAAVPQPRSPEERSSAPLPLDGPARFPAQPEPAAYQFTAAAAPQPARPAEQGAPRNGGLLLPNGAAGGGTANGGGAPAGDRTGNGASFRPSPQWSTAPGLTVDTQMVPLGGRRTADEQGAPAPAPVSGSASVSGRVAVPQPAVPQPAAPAAEEPDAGPRGRRAAPEEPAAAPKRPGDVEQTRIKIWDEESVTSYRTEWHEVKAQFVDDPVVALTRAHDLLTEAVHQLTDGLLAERDDLDPLKRSDSPDTESMRVAMRGYREFLDRILTL
ncbi:hypothetical protein [Spirilliplanes yamanashiensis]|uniref:Uncharacterized protein n=1 Tax=Spirilliplanes yamanashiensis TaxID=42233 RepID=A0A8J4DJH4_9ACTN|nr:hypothetical protein [Spirilliplanes yamanashiensis]MDP9817014.1 hypothetical protein [Spirilliplanes yamanashiensis]GIJ03329.1 hypothetical protein Sya03_26810 [Spirilliplanes yamanashiensis]